MSFAPISSSAASASIGAKLPEWIRSDLKAEPSPGDRALVRLIFFGETAFQPLTARLVAELGADVNILAGAIEEIGTRPFGSLIVGLPAARLAESQAFLQEHGLLTEVLGYVG